MLGLKKILDEVKAVRASVGLLRLDLADLQLLLLRKPENTPPAKKPKPKPGKKSKR